MQPLRITEAPDLKLHPEDLFHSMESSCLSLDALLKNLNVSFDNLQETLLAPETSALLDAKQKIAALQVQLIALRAAPMAMVRLINLSNESEKPEVARRAASSVLHISGIPTNTAPQPPAAPPVPLPKIASEEEIKLCLTDEEASEFRSSLVWCQELKRAIPNLNAAKFYTETPASAIAALVPFFAQPQKAPPGTPAPDPLPNPPSTPQPKIKT